MITDAQWLGLVMRSEDDEPHAWWSLGWVVRNRLESPLYPDTYQDVIVQRRQFSYFVPFIGLAPQEALPPNPR